MKNFNNTPQTNILTGTGDRASFSTLSNNELKQLLDLPNMESSTAVKDSGCFFDSLAQCLNALKNTDQYSEKSLRLDCFNYFKDHENWVNSLHRDDCKKHQNASSIVSYDLVQYTSAEIKKMGVKDAIWGRPNVEGLILCRYHSDFYGIHYIKLNTNSEKNTGQKYSVTHFLITRKSVIPTDLTKIPEGLPTIVTSQDELHTIPLIPSKNRITSLHKSVKSSLGKRTHQQVNLNINTLNPSHKTIKLNQSQDSELGRTHSISNQNKIIDIENVKLLWISPKGIFTDSKWKNALQDIRNSIQIVSEKINCVRKSGNPFPRVINIPNGVKEVEISIAGKETESTEIMQGYKIKVEKNEANFCDLKFIKTSMDVIGITHSGFRFIFTFFGENKILFKLCCKYLVVVNISGKLIKDPQDNINNRVSIPFFTHQVKNDVSSSADNFIGQTTQETETNSNSIINSESAESSGSEESSNSEFTKKFTLQDTENFTAEAIPPSFSDFDPISFLDLQQISNLFDEKTTNTTTHTQEPTSDQTLSIIDQFELDYEKDTPLKKLETTLNSNLFSTTAQLLDHFQQSKTQNAMEYNNGQLLENIYGDSNLHQLPTLLWISPKTKELSHYMIHRWKKFDNTLVRDTRGLTEQEWREKFQSINPNVVNSLTLDCIPFPRIIKIPDKIKSVQVFIEGYQELTKTLISGSTVNVINCEANFCDLKFKKTTAMMSNNSHSSWKLIFIFFDASKQIILKLRTCDQIIVHSNSFDYDNYGKLRKSNNEKPQICNQNFSKPNTEISQNIEMHSPNKNDKSENEKNLVDDNHSNIIVI